MDDGSINYNIARRDQYLAIAAVSIFLVLAVLVDLHGVWGNLNSPQEYWLLEIFPIALFVGAMAFGWYAYRRWRECYRELQNRIAINERLTQEIAEREQLEAGLAEQRAMLEITFDCMPDGISVLDADQNLVAYNQRYVELWRFPPGFIRVGMNCEEISRFRIEQGYYGAADVEEHVGQRTASKERNEVLSDVITFFDGTTIALNAMPMPGGGYVSTHTDITERNKVESALLESEARLKQHIAELEDSKAQYEAQQKELKMLSEDLAMARDHAEAASLAKSEFLATMSHELRTPLNAIIGFSEIIRSETFGPVGSDRYRDYAGDIHGSGQHLLDIINDILDLSKVESGAGELLEDSLKVPVVIDAVLTLVRQRADKRGVRLELELPDDVPKLLADQRKVMQVLVNLLSNGIKFTETGGMVSMKVSCDADAGYIFEVADTGIGIAQEKIPIALSQFGQIDSALSRDHDGTGLGLPLASTLMELHGGSLELQSELGVGTVVTVRFPPWRIGGLSRRIKHSPAA